MIEGIADHTNELLEAAGISDAEAALAAGEEGLTSIHGIGPKTANEILVAAKAALAEKEETAGDAPADSPPEESEVVTPDSPDGADTDWVWVQATRDVSIAHKVLLAGETRTVRRAHYRQVLVANPGSLILRSG